MGSASLAAARPAARPPARTVTTIPLQPEGLRGKNYRYVLTCFIAVDQTPNLETIMLRNG